MALASQTARMTSNRSYMMSNASRRRRRAQRRNLAIAIVGIGGAVLLIGWLVVPTGEKAPPTDTLGATPPDSSLSPGVSSPSPFGPSNASASDRAAPAQSSTMTPTQNTRAGETAQSRPTGMLPDPQPIVRTDPTPPANAAVIEMGAPTQRPSVPDRAQAAVETATTTTSAPTTPARPQSSPSGVLPASAATGDLLARADALVAQSKPVEARDILNRALFDGATREADRDAIRARIAGINDTIIFGRAVVAGDKVTGSYTIAPGDSLARIVSREGLDIDWRLLAQVNSISDPRRIRVGQTIKTLQGPFHAVVYKSRFRLDLFANATDSAGNRLFIRSFRVGLGEAGSTPVGAFVVRPSSKLINPVWTNPRTGEHFAADNPMNPIGEHWIGLDPANEASAAYTQYGLHGTIEPGSIGREMSMGCVRLDAPDIELLYGFLVETKSTVDILP